MTSILLANTTIEGAQSYSIELENCQTASIEVVATITSTAKTFVDASVSVAADTVTITSHGLANGTKVQLTSTGTLPGGLALATNYYVYVVDANTISFYDTLAHLLAAASTGVNTIAAGKIDITSAAGGGTHTVTPVTVSGASYKLQKSNSYRYQNITDTGATFVDLVTGETDSVVTNTISATATSAASYKNVAAQWLRITFAVGAGSIGIKVFARLDRRA